MRRVGAVRLGLEVLVVWVWTFGWQSGGFGGVLDEMMKVGW